MSLPFQLLDDGFNVPSPGMGRRRLDRRPRWLVELRRIGSFLYLSDIPGRLYGVEWEFPSSFAAEDITWDQGVESVEDAGLEVDLVQMRMPLAAATVRLTPDCRRFFEPLDELWHAYVRVSALGRDGRIRTLVRGDISARDIEHGYDGEAVSFRVVEKWRRNELFPPAVNDSRRVLAAKAIEDTIDEAYTYAWGGAHAVPTMAVRSMATEEQSRQMIVGHGLRRGRGVGVQDADPCPYTGFPQDDWPDVGGLRRESVVGGFYGVNRLLRLACETVGVPGGFDVVEGSFAQNESGSTQLESTANDSTAVWALWNYQKSLSLAMNVEAIDGTAIVVVYWNFVDVNNHARVEIPFGGSEVTIRIVEGGVVVTEEAKEVEGGVPSDQSRVTIDVLGGRLTVGIKEKGGTADATTVELGTTTTEVGGNLAIGSKSGKVRWHGIYQPSILRRLSTESDPNASIKHFKDELQHSYVGEGYREALGEPLYFNLRGALGVVNAGRLLERLIRDYSGVDETELDLEWEGTLLRLFEDLRRFRVGGYCNDRKPIFELIEERLQPQFNFVVTQQGGLVRGYVFDPTKEPELDLRYGVDMLELAEPVGEVERYTRYTVRAKLFAPGTEDRGRLRKWRKEARLTPEESEYLAYVESLVGGKVDFPDVECRDVVDEPVVEQVLQMKALMFHDGKRYAYRMDEAGMDIPFGLVPQLTDEARNLDEQKAMLVGRRWLSPEYCVNVFRSLHEFEEPFAPAGTGVTPEPEPEVCEEDAIAGSELPSFADCSGSPTSCWTISESGEVVIGGGPSGQDALLFTDAESGDGIILACGCGYTAGGTVNAVSVGAWVKAVSLGGIQNHRISVDWKVYSNASCVGDPVKSGLFTLQSGSINGDTGWACASDNIPTGVPILTVGQHLVVSFTLFVGIGTPFVHEYFIADPWISTTGDLC